VILDEILQERCSSSRNRINARGVKRKMSNYNLRHAGASPLAGSIAQSLSKFLSEQYCGLAYLIRTDL
jgi:hypothetical protein